MAGQLSRVASPHAHHAGCTVVPYLTGLLSGEDQISAGGEHDQRRPNHRRAVAGVHRRPGRDRLAADCGPRSEAACSREAARSGHPARTRPAGPSPSLSGGQPSGTRSLPVTSQLTPLRVLTAWGELVRHNRGPAHAQATSVLHAMRLGVPGREMATPVLTGVDTDRPSGLNVVSST